MLGLVGLEPGSVIAGDALEEAKRLWAADFDLSHVADVEQSGALSDRQVLLGDARIFNRHLPAPELDHLCPRGFMDRVQRRALQRNSRRSGQPDPFKLSVFDKSQTRLANLAHSVRGGQGSEGA